MVAQSEVSAMSKIRAQKKHENSGQAANSNFNPIWEKARAVDIHYHELQEEACRIDLAVDG